MAFGSVLAPPPGRDLAAEALTDRLDELTLLEIRRRLRVLRAATNAEAVFLALAGLIVEHSGKRSCAPLLPFMHTQGPAADLSGHRGVVCYVRIPKQTVRCQLLVMNPEGVGYDAVLALMRGTKEELETLIVEQITQARGRKR